MTIQNNKSHEDLRAALEALKELNVPEHLQQVALAHLLAGRSNARSDGSSREGTSGEVAADKADLRTFVGMLKPKGAVAEIPTLLYWAALREQRKAASEKDVIELYRRAGLRPPKDVSQSLRDLCSKKYMRLESIEGERGMVRLARAGEDFVIHDLIANAT